MEVTQCMDEQTIGSGRQVRGGAGRLKAWCWGLVCWLAVGVPVMEAQTRTQTTPSHGEGSATVALLPVQIRLNFGDYEGKVVKEALDRTVVTIAGVPQEPGLLFFRRAAGSYPIVVRVPGFQDQSGTVRVGFNEPPQVTVTMNRETASVRLIGEPAENFTGLTFTLTPVYPVSDAQGGLTVTGRLHQRSADTLLTRFPVGTYDLRFDERGGRTRIEIHGPPPGQPRQEVRLSTNYLTNGRVRVVAPAGWAVYFNQTNLPGSRQVGPVRPGEFIDLPRGSYRAVLQPDGVADPTVAGWEQPINLGPGQEAEVRFAQERLGQAWLRVTDIRWDPEVLRAHPDIAERTELRVRYEDGREERRPLPAGTGEMEFFVPPGRAKLSLGVIGNAEAGAELRVPRDGREAVLVVHRPYPLGMIETGAYYTGTLRVGGREPGPGRYALRFDPVGREAGPAAGVTKEVEMMVSATALQTVTLPAGTWRMKVTRVDYLATDTPPPPLEQEVVLAPGEARELRVDFSHFVFGRLRVEGRGLKGARYELVPERAGGEAPAAMEQTEEAGVAWARLNEGTYRLRGTFQGETIPDTTVQVMGGVERVVTVDRRDVIQGEVRLAVDQRLARRLQFLNQETGEVSEVTLELDRGTGQGVYGTSLFDLQVGSRDENLVLFPSAWLDRGGYQVTSPELAGLEWTITVRPRLRQVGVMISKPENYNASAAMEALVKGELAKMNPGWRDSSRLVLTQKDASGTLVTRWQPPIVGEAGLYRLEEGGARLVRSTPVSARQGEARWDLPPGRYRVEVSGYLSSDPATNYRGQVEGEVQPFQSTSTQIRLGLDAEANQLSQLIRTRAIPSSTSLRFRVISDLDFRRGDGLWMGLTEVPKAFYYAIMNPSQAGQLSEEEKDMPMTGLSWDEVQAFCVQLNSRRELLLNEAARHLVFRLPTEKEWSELWQTSARTAVPGRTGLRPVGGFGEDRWVYLSGNVWEFVLDPHGPRLSHSRNPAQLKLSQRRVPRTIVGGSWLTTSAPADGAYPRSVMPQGHRGAENVGFRLVLAQPNTP